MSRNAQIVLTTLCIGLLAFLSSALADDDPAQRPVKNIAAAIATAAVTVIRERRAWV